MRGRCPPAPERTPDRPGPGPVPDAVLRSLDLAVLRRVQSLVPGDHLTPQVGSGTELALIRPYLPGDDVRYIDWNVTARMREPHVRVHVGERAMTAWLMLDVSPSMTFGTTVRRKADVAEGVALAVGHVATRRGNRLGVRRLRRPRAARGAAAPGPASACSGCSPSCARSPRRTGPAGAAALADAVAARRGAGARSRGLVVVVSDFRGPRDWEDGLRTLSARHGVLAVEIRDPRELELPPVGDVFMVDPESGRQIVVNTSRKRVRERFKAAAAAEREAVATALRRRRRRPPRAEHGRRLAARPRRPPAPGGADAPRRAGGGRSGPGGDRRACRAGTSSRTRTRRKQKRRAVAGPAPEGRGELPRAHRPARPAAAAAGRARLRGVPAARRKREAAAFANPALMPNLVPRLPGFRRHVPAALFLLAAAVLVVALARPQRTVAAPQRAANVILVHDVSGSMRADDVEPSRLAAAHRSRPRCSSTRPPTTSAWGS